ncbi:hypothetical protein AAC387_Pa11g2010 [Persea americana]
MKMAANSNMSFHHGVIQASTFNRHAIAFQSGAINSSAGMIPVGNSGGFGIIPGGNSAGMSNMAGVIPSGGSGCGLLLDTLPGLKHDGGLAVEWSFDEQSILEEGLAKYADETNIMRYIKIAAALRQKTVRDVALRCRWMTRKENGKRRKPEDHYTGKKMKDRKEKLMDSASKTNIPLAPQQNILAYSFMMQHREDNDRNSCDALSGTTRHLLDENDRVFSQIAANLATFKIQDNMDLFFRTKNNITAILNDMRRMPGIMSRMPPLPVSIDEELTNTIFCGTGQMQTPTFGSPHSISLKQEPRC